MKQAVSSPLLETTIEGASHVIINISGDISLIEANEAASYVQELAGDDANIIFGAMYDESAQDEASITVIATGLDDHEKAADLSSAMNRFQPYKSQAASAEAAAAAPQTHSFSEARPAAARPVAPAPSRSAAPQTGTAGQASSQGTTPSPYRPNPKEVQINIPEFLRNKR